MDANTIAGVIVACAIAVSFIAAAFASKNWSTYSDQRLRHIERRLDQLADHLGIAPSPLPPELQEVRGLLRKGNKVAAIKRYRAIRGVGLKEAKAAVEELDE